MPRLPAAAASPLTVFLVTYEAAHDWFKLGLFSSRAQAEAAVARAAVQPGFSNDPTLFHVDDIVLDRTYCLDGSAASSTRPALPTTLFHVQYERNYSDGRPYGDWLNVGVFTTREQAEEAVEILATRPGFRECPDAFTISEAVLDSMSWEEGFKYVGRSRPRRRRR